MIPLFARRFARIVDRATKSEPLNHERGSTDFPSKFSKSLRRVENRVNFLLSPHSSQYPSIRSKGYYTLSFVRQLGGRREGTTTPKLSLEANPVKEVGQSQKFPRQCEVNVATSSFINNSQRRP